jgi:hypothetical protein
MGVPIFGARHVNTPSRKIFRRKPLVRRGLCGVWKIGVEKPNGWVYGLGMETNDMNKNTNPEAHALAARMHRMYKNSPCVVAALAGDWGKAADLCRGTWGLWAECRRMAGLPDDIAAQVEIEKAKIAAARAARYAKR